MSDLFPDSTCKLVEDACPSIAFRIRSEVLGQPGSSEKMVELHAQILQDPIVLDVLNWRQADGWLGWDFHGTKGIEAGIRILCEKGVQHNHPVLADALNALEKYTERLDRGIVKVGRLVDEMGLGGPLLIRATVFAYAGIEDKTFVQEQIEKALVAFAFVSPQNSIADIAEEYRGKLVFKPSVQWPSIYHLRLLAFTRHWRTEKNRMMIAKAVRRLIELSPLPDIYIRNKSQLIAPASFCMHNFNLEMDQMDDAHWMMWFHRMECLARLGIVSLVPELQAQVSTMKAMLDVKGFFIKKLTHPYFSKWGAYSGLMLEPDWRTQKNRVYDLTFRSKLILHYAENEVA